MLDIENLTLKQLKEINHLFNISQQKTENEDNGKIKICILQRGWVMVGRFYQNGSECKLINSYTIRRWGTENGLGELAEKGVLKETKLDKNTETKFHELTMVASLLCNENNWKKYVE
jgi:hypothetical protein